MAKKTTGSVAKPVPRKQDPSSIHDIFASSSKRPSAQPASTSSTTKAKSNALPPQPPMTDDAAKKSEKMPHVSIRSEPIPSSSQKSSPVQTIHDSSTAPLPQPPPTTIALKRPKSSAKRARKEVDEDELFRDSRGYGPRRKTEEGFLIYKEAELRISPEAGGMAPYMRLS